MQWGKVCLAKMAKASAVCGKICQPLPALSYTAVRAATERRAAAHQAPSWLSVFGVRRRVTHISMAKATSSTAVPTSSAKDSRRNSA